MGERYFLSTDGDGHWYLVPDAHRAEWQEWADLDGDDERAWEPPDYAKPLGGGPQGITFTDPQGLL